MELYLIRHGQSFNNALKDSSQRVCDPPLTEIGVAQAERAGEYLKAAPVAPGSLETPVADVQNKTGYVFTRIFCSAMLRTLQTTLPIANALDMRPEIWLDVHEEGGIWRDAGDGQGPIGYSGLTRGEIEAQFPGFAIPDEITDKGWWNRPMETKEEWTARAEGVASVLHEKFADTDERIAVVCHGGFADDLLHALLSNGNGRLDGIYFSQQNTAFSRLDFLEEKVHIRYLNRVEHLPAEWIT